jgi:hypothetical protein
MYAQTDGHHVTCWRSADVCTDRWTSCDVLEERGSVPDHGDNVYAQADGHEVLQYESKSLVAYQEPEDGQADRQHCSADVVSEVSGKGKWKGGTRYRVLEHHQSWLILSSGSI